MKKLFSLALALVLVVSSMVTLVACDEEKDNAVDENVMSAKEAYEQLINSLYEKEFYTITIESKAYTKDGEEYDNDSLFIQRDGSLLAINYGSSMNTLAYMDRGYSYSYNNGNWDRSLDKMDAHAYIEQYIVSNFDSTLSADLFGEYDSSKQYYPILADAVKEFLSTDGDSIRNASGYMKVENSTYTIIMKIVGTVEGNSITGTLSITADFSDTTIEIPDGLPALEK